MKLSDYDTMLLKKHKNAVAFLKKFSNPPVDENGNKEITVSSSYIYQHDIFVNINNIEQLSIARKYLKENLGEWEDKISYIHPYQDTVSCEWTGITKDLVRFVIRMICPIEDFPNNLLPSESCRIETVEVTVKESRVVCEKRVD